MPASIILGEGVADDAFLEKLIATRGLNNHEVIKPKKPEAYGQGGFGSRLEGLKVNGVGPRPAVVIVADNDDDPTIAFQEIQRQIGEAGDYLIPSQPYQLSARGKYPQIAVVMLPAAGVQGSLDSLCLSAVNPKYAKELSCAEAHARCLPADAASWGITKFSKLKVQCLLSSICKKDPYTPLKSAWLVSAKTPGDIFVLGNPVFDYIATFLASLPLH